MPYTLPKRNVILSAVKACVRKRTHKFGIELPTSIAHAKELDRLSGYPHWSNALVKEMTNVGVAFEVLPEGLKAPPGHLVWDLKMDFTRKAR